MKVQSRGEFRGWDDIGAGQLFVFWIDTAAHLGMKIRASGADGDIYFGIAALTPGIVGYEKAPGMLWPEKFDSQMYLYIADAFITPEIALDTLVFSQSPSSGDLVQTTLGLILVISEGSGLISFNIESGQVTPYNYSNSLRYSGWKILVPGSPHPEILFEWPIRQA